MYLIMTEWNNYTSSKHYELLPPEPSKHCCKVLFSDTIALVELAVVAVDTLGVEIVILPDVFAKIEHNTCAKNRTQHEFLKIVHTQCTIVK